MKRLLAISITLILFAYGAFAESIDYSNMSDEDLHSMIDTARNELTKRELVAGEKTVLVDQDGVQLYLTGDIDFRESSDSKYTEIGVVLINDSDRKISISIEDLYVNGWSIFAMCGASAESGKKDKATIDMSLDEAEINNFQDIEEMEFTVRVYDGESYDDLFTVGPMTVHFN